LNWLDILLIAVVVAGILVGLKEGLIGTAFVAAGGFIGCLLAGQLGDKVGGLFEDSVSSDTIVTAISYIIIIVLAIVVARTARGIVRPFLTIATLGLSAMVDRVGGLALGLAVGLALAGALIVVMARLAYNFELPTEGTAGEVAERIPNVEDTREALEGALVDSALASVFIDIADAIPGDTLGFVPSDFKMSLDILEERIDAKDQESPP
jgi:uncharacterized membrane protein required for colicin V production